MSEKIERLTQWANGRIAYPVSIELGPTLKCNLNCLFCWRYGKKVEYGKELTTEKYLEIIKEAKGMSVKEIKIIGGGEPFVRNDLLKIMEEVKSQGMRGYVCTNGVLFSEKIIEKLVNIGWDYIKISLHGATEKTHDNLVKQPGSFKKIIHAVELFNKYKKKFSKNTPYIEFGFVLVKKNYKQVAEIIKLGSKVNVQAAFVEPITAYTKTGSMLKLNKKEVDEFRGYAKKTLELAKKYGIDSNLSNFVGSDLIEKTGNMQSEIKIDATSCKNKFLVAACFEPWYRMGIRNDGVVCPCGFFDVDTKENVNEKSLKEIWFGDYFKKFRLKMLENNLPDYCSKCCTTLVDNNRIIRNELEKVL